MKKTEHIEVDPNCRLTPTPEGIVTWCGVSRDDERFAFLVTGVASMLNRYVETCGLAEDHKKMCGRLREYCEWRHLGLGGEKLDELVLQRARQLETMIARLRGLMYRWYESKTLADTLLSESVLLMPQPTRGGSQADAAVTGEREAEAVGTSERG